MREIGRLIGRDVSTVSRELKRNRRQPKRKPEPVVYDPSVAQAKYKNRRRQAKYAGMLVYENTELRHYVIQRLKCGLSPEAIAGRMRYERQPFYASEKSIYAFLYSVWGQRWCRYLKSRRYRRRKRKGLKPKRTLIPNKTSIHDRPDVAGQYGHFEADTIVSGKKTKATAALSVLYELASMYIDARKIPTTSPRYHTKAQCAMLAKWKKVRTVTQDNGIENAYHERLKTNTYFCDSHAPWQKPGIENANKLIRRFIPKGSNIGFYSAAFVRIMVLKLNGTPRKALGWKTPSEVVREKKLLRSK